MQLPQGHGLHVGQWVVELLLPEGGIGMMKGEGLVDVESGLAVVAETEGGVADEMALQIAGQAVELADAHAGGQQSHKLVGPFVLQGVHRTADGCDGLALGKDVGPGNVVFLVE